MQRIRSALLFLGLTFSNATTPQATSSGNLSLERFREMLVRVFETNPEIVKTAILRAEAIESAEQAARTKRAAANLMRDAVSGASPLPTVGSPAATVIILQVIDYRCSYCR